MLFTLKNIVHIVIMVLTIFLHKILSNLIINNEPQNYIDNKQNTNNYFNNEPQMTEKSYIEYHMDHKVGQKEASLAFKKFRNKLLNEKSPAWCQDTPCTDEIIKYCGSQNMLNDHCCCDARHNQEQLPWIPHSCYVGDECRPFTGSCFKYTEWRECCCDRILAKKWSNLFSSSTKLLVNSLMLFLCASYYCYYYY